MISFGFDAPDLAPGDVFRLRNVGLWQNPVPTRYAPAGELTSRPMRVTAGSAVVTCIASTPLGTDVAVQLRHAPDAGGTPRGWSPWTRQRTATQPYKRAPMWVQYRLRLHTRDERVTPIDRDDAGLVWRRRGRR